MSANEEVESSSLWLTTTYFSTRYQVQGISTEALIRDPSIKVTEMLKEIAQTLNPSIPGPARGGISLLVSA